MPLPPLRPHDALLLVDVQNDFCPGGALPVAEGDRVVPVLNRWIEAAQRGGATLVARAIGTHQGISAFTNAEGPGRRIASKVRPVPSFIRCCDCPRIIYW